PELGRSDVFKGAALDDVQKALKDSAATGSLHFPIRYDGEHLVWGAFRYATIEGEDITPEGTFDGTAACMASKAIGRGEVFYCGSNLGLGAEKGDTGLAQIIARCARRAGIQPTLTAGESSAGQVHADLLLAAAPPAEVPRGDAVAADLQPAGARSDKRGERFLVVHNRSAWAQNVIIHAPGKWKGVYSGAQWELDGLAGTNVPAGFCYLFADAEGE
ncbi:MAG: hypothetical protein M1457_01465, partial [bacterium]|nr:hypothetical protein [bacterium]